MDSPHALRFTYPSLPRQRRPLQSVVTFLVPNPIHSLVQPLAPIVARLKQMELLNGRAEISCGDAQQTDRATCPRFLEERPCGIVDRLIEMSGFGQRHLPRVC